MLDRWMLLCAVFCENNIDAAGFGPSSNIEEGKRNNDGKNTRQNMARKCQVEHY
jgi:hypothetical protein